MMTFVYILSLFVSSITVLFSGLEFLDACMTDSINSLKFIPIIFVLSLLLLISSVAGIKGGLGDD